VNLFSKAAAGMSLTPGQRTLLRAVEMIVYAAIVSFFGVLPALTGGFTQVNWGVLAGALGVAFLSALSKWFKAHGDAPLSDALDAAAPRLQQFAGIPNDVVIEAELPAMDGTDDAGPAVAPAAPQG